MFCSYVSDRRYGWVPFCEKQFGDVPSRICFEWNTPRHTTDDAVPTRRRAFTKAELQHFFDVVDDFVDEQHQAGSKRWLTALRDSIAFKVGYAYGLRRRELVMLDLTDFGPNPHVPRYGDYGAMTVRWAKDTAGSGPQRLNNSDSTRRGRLHSITAGLWWSRADQQCLPLTDNRP
jgi:integrase/recombinase XerD